MTEQEFMERRWELLARYFALSGPQIADLTMRQLNDLFDYLRCEFVT